MIKKETAMLKIIIISFIAISVLVWLFFRTSSLFAINVGFDLPEDFRSSYNFQYAQDFSYQKVIRKSINITVAKGLSKTDIESNIKYSIKEYLTSQEKAINALSVFVYRDSDEEFSTYTVARGIFAPNGKWEDADKFRSYADCKLVIDYRDNYFKIDSDPNNNLKIGQKVVIKKGSRLSISPGNWTDEETILKLSEDTPAVIIERKVLPIGEFDMIRYKITVNSDEGDITGWVHSYNINL